MGLSTVDSILIKNSHNNQTFFILKDIYIQKES